MFNFNKITTAIGTYFLNAVQFVKNWRNKEKTPAAPLPSGITSNECEPVDKKQGTMIRWIGIIIGIIALLFLLSWLFSGPGSDSSNEKAPDAPSSMWFDRYDYGDTLTFSVEYVFWGFAILSVISFLVYAIKKASYEKKLAAFKVDLELSKTKKENDGKEEAAPTDKDKKPSLLERAAAIEIDFENANGQTKAALAFSGKMATIFAILFIISAIMWSFFPETLYKNRGLTEDSRILGEKKQSEKKMGLFRLESGLDEKQVSPLNGDEDIVIGKYDYVYVPDIHEVFPGLGVKAILQKDYAKDWSEKGKWFYIFPSAIIPYKELEGIKVPVMTGQTIIEGYGIASTSETLAGEMHYTFSWFKDLSLVYPMVNGDSIVVDRDDLVIVYFQDILWRYREGDISPKEAVLAVDEKTEAYFEPNPDTKSSFKYRAAWYPTRKGPLTLHVKGDNGTKRDFWFNSPHGQDILVVVKKAESVTASL